MILYHGTSKENAESIKRNGFSSEYAKAIYFTNCYKSAKYNAGESGEVIKVKILNINYLKLDKDYCPNNKKHSREIKSIIMYLLFNSKKNSLLNYNKNEYIFFNQFNYKIVSEKKNK